MQNRSNEEIAYIASLRERISAFNDADFGELDRFESPFPPPEVYPTKGMHPRILVTRELLCDIRANLKHPENKPAYERYLALSETVTDGVLRKTNGYDEHNMDNNLLTVIESKAFRYLIDGDEKYGYEAILAMKNFILTLSVPISPIRTLFDYCRAFGYAMYTIALVYDWCYPLLTEHDRRQLLSGVQSRLANHLELSYPPTGNGGGFVGHGTEAQLYRDWFAVAIAVADEYPDVYELIAGKLFVSHRDAANYYLQSGAHWQGSSYTPYRYQHMLISHILFSRMTNGSFSFFNEGLHSVGHFLLQTLRPDGIDYMIGDGRGSPEYRAGSLFYAACFYRDPVLKGFAKKYLKDFTSFTNASYTTLLTPVLFLALNDPKLVPAEDYEAELPLVAYYGSPRGNILARSAWKDPDAVSVYMKIGECYTANHEHRDSGHFMIYYKGLLAVDSGVYAAHYGCCHDFSYLKQTISHNCMLVFNPALDNTDNPQNCRYSGGQSTRDLYEPQNLADWKKKGTFNQAKIIGADYLTEGKVGAETYRWSYLAGDLTGAYTADTVDVMHRYMLSIMTGDPKNPMAFFVFDRVSAVDPSFKKTYLLHTMAQPEVKGSTASVIYGGGKLHTQTLLSDVTYTAIGGAKGEIVGGVENETDKQFWIIDRNYYAEDDPNYVIPESKDPAWGRIEVSPKNAEKTTLMLNVMYVTDAENGAETIPAKEIVGEGLTGAEILGKTVLFPTDELILGKSASVKCEGEGETEYFIAGLKAGRWSVSLGDLSFEASCSEKGILNFRGKLGDLTVTPLD